MAETSRNIYFKIETKESKKNHKNQVPYFFSLLRKSKAEFNGESDKIIPR